MRKSGGRKSYFVGYGTEQEIVAQHSVSPEAHLRREYGITREDFALLYRRQEGACAICEEFFLKLVVDHQHRDGVKGECDDVRGLLCRDCNLALGHFQDNTDRIASAVGYLLFYEENDCCWNGNNACHICRDPQVSLKVDRVAGEPRGSLCLPCAAGLRGFRRVIFNLRMALCYLHYYECRPLGEPYWRNGPDGELRYGTLYDEVPEDLLYGQWWEVQKVHFPRSGNRTLEETRRLRKPL